ncbi:MAG: class I SAM-dependent methyltransferase [Parvularculaceae bacterium]
MKTIMMTAAAAALAMAAACQPAGNGNAPAGDAAVVETPAAEYEAAVANAARSDADRARDKDRKPAETLAFIGLKTGDQVFEVEGGGGYFTELYSYVVGDHGAVVMQNFQGFADYAKDEIAARLDGNRLPNVRQSISLHDALDAADESMDIATWVQGPHELYYKPEPDTDLGDPQGSFNEIFRILKPGGMFVVIDHAAEAGAPTSTGNDLHRIDKAHVLKLAMNAGFVLSSESEFLANPADDHTKPVFDASVSGHTDQFALRFKKPH